MWHDLSTLLLSFLPSPLSVFVKGISHVFEHLPLASDFMRTLVLMEATLKAENEVHVHVHVGVVWYIHVHVCILTGLLCMFTVAMFVIGTYGTKAAATSSYKEGS